MSSTAPAQTCAHCSAKGKMRCSRCTRVWYCSKDCQKSDWRNHTLICRTQAQAARVANEEAERVAALEAVRIANEEAARLAAVEESFLHDIDGSVFSITCNVAVVLRDGRCATTAGRPSVEGGVVTYPLLLADGSPHKSRIEDFEFLDSPKPLVLECVDLPCVSAMLCTGDCVIKVKDAVEKSDVPGHRLKDKTVGPKEYCDALVAGAKAKLANIAECIAQARDAAPGLYGPLYDALQDRVKKLSRSLPPAPPAASTALPAGGVPDRVQNSLEWGNGAVLGCGCPAQCFAGRQFAVQTGDLTLVPVTRMYFAVPWFSQAASTVQGGPAPAAAT